LTGGPPSRIFDFAPDEACRFPASPENGGEVLPAAKLLPKSNKNRYLSGIVANAEVGSYPAFSPLSYRISGRTVYFLWRYLSPITEARELPGIMPCGARTFLPTIVSGGSLVHR